LTTAVTSFAAAITAAAKNEYYIYETDGVNQLSPYSESQSGYQLAVKCSIAKVLGEILIIILNIMELRINHIF
jgi:hypothetical protein